MGCMWLYKPKTWLVVIVLCLAAVAAWLCRFTAFTEPEELATLKHTAFVTCMAFSPGGRVLAVGSDGGTITLWDVTTGTQKATLKGRVGKVRHVAFQPGGQTLASVSSDQMVKLWDVADGKDFFTLRLGREAGAVHAVAYSRGDKPLAAVAGSTTLDLWDLAGGDHSTIRHGHTWFLTRVAFSPEGRALVSADAGFVFKLWDVASGRNTATFKERAKAGAISILADMAFTPDGKTLALAIGDTIKVWDWAGGKRVATLENHESCDFTAVAFSPDGETLAAGDEGGSATLWDVTSGRRRATLEGYGWSVSPLVFSPTGETLAGAAGSAIKLWGRFTSRESHPSKH